MTTRAEYRPLRSFQCSGLPAISNPFCDVICDVNMGEKPYNARASNDFNEMEWWAMRDSKSPTSNFPH